MSSTTMLFNREGLSGKLKVSMNNTVLLVPLDMGTLYPVCLILSGPIVRITPREVHVKDVGFLNTIYLPSNHYQREKDWIQTRGLDVAMSTSGTISHELHRRRREALNPFFRKKNVMVLESLINSKVLQFCDHLDSSNGPVNLYDLYYALAREYVYEPQLQARINEKLVKDWQYRVPVQLRQR